MNGKTLEQIWETEYLNNKGKKFPYETSTYVEGECNYGYFKGFIKTSTIKREYPVVVIGSFRTQKWGTFIECNTDYVRHLLPLD